jgi:hypothetical protein
MVKYTITFSDLTTAGTAQTLYLSADPGGNAFQTPSTTAPPNAQNFAIPQAGVILYAKVHHTTAFSGGTIASMTVSVGKLGGSNTFVTPAFNVFQAAGDTTLQETFAIPSGQISPWGITVTFTSTVGNVNAATAGSVDIYLAYINVTSPSE